MAETVFIYSEEVTDVTYVMDRVRVRVKAIGSLTPDSAGTAAQPYVPTSAKPAAEITLGAAAGASQVILTVLYTVCVYSLTANTNPSIMHCTMDFLIWRA